MDTNEEIIMGKDYRTGEPIEVHLSAGRIVDIRSPDQVVAFGQLPWIAPGLVDLQVNGFGGGDFNQVPLLPSSVKEITRSLWAYGVTEYLPTLITNDSDALMQAIKAIRRAVNAEEAIAQSVAGIHLEGPFISSESGARGAHDVRWITAPDWDLFQRWQEIAEGSIQLITLSPEWDESPEFIRECVKSGVRVAIGHTAATTDQIRKAIEMGASLSTHLGNGAHAMLKRHPNYLWDQLASDELWASFIADGFHLPPSVIKVILRMKSDQAFLVSDTVSLAGLAPGTYQTHVGGKVVLSKEGRLYLEDDPELLAGSVQPLINAISYLAQTGLASLSDAWNMASVRPAVYMDLQSQSGLEVGGKSNVVVFTVSDNLLTVEKTYVNSMLKYQKS